MNWLTKYLNGTTMLYAADGGGGGGGEQQQPPVQPPFPTDPNAEWKIGDKPWYSYLPDGPTKELYTAKNYKNPIVAADSHYSANKMVSGGNIVELPGDSATPEQIEAFQRKLGRPETIDGYKDVKWGDNADEKFVGLGKNVAFKLGLSPKQAETLATEWNTFAAAQAAEWEKASTEKNAADIAALKTQFGADYDAMLAGGSRALKALTALKGQDGKAVLSQDDVNAIEASIGAAPLVKLLAVLGSLTKEMKLPEGGGGAGAPADPGGMSAVQAKQEIDKLMADPTFTAAYYDKDKPGHRENVERLRKLHEAASRT